MDGKPATREYFWTYSRWLTLVCRHGGGIYFGINELCGYCTRNGLVYGSFLKVVAGMLLDLYHDTFNFWSRALTCLMGFICEVSMFTWVIWFRRVRL